MATLTESQLSQLLRAAADVALSPGGAGPFSIDKLHLYVAMLDVQQTTPLTTFTAAQATFTGYAAQVLVWDDPSVSADGTVEVVAAPLTFRPTDAVAPNSVWGVYVTDTGATEWHFAGQIDGAPVPMASALNQIIVTVRYRPATNSLVVTVQ